MVKRVRELESASEGLASPSIERLVADHRALVGDLFPEDAGRFRWKHGGEWETGPFGIGVGTGAATRVRPVRGSHPRKIRVKLADEFRRFHEGRKELEGRSSAGEEVGAREAAFLAGRLYVRLLKIHPFVDGNLRTAYLSLQAALLTLGLPGVEFPPDEVRHNEALIVAMAPGGRRQSYDPITDLILEQIPLDT
jgi:fido (protein-threonine AMPylation protein)